MSSEKEQFKAAVEKYLLPMFPRTSLTEIDPKNSSLHAAYDMALGQSALRLQLHKDSSHALLISRSQYFDDDEKRTATSFVKKFREILPNANQSFWPSLADVEMNSVVADAVSPEAFSTLRAAIDSFAKWSQETYEGHRISAAIGISLEESQGRPTLTDFFKLNLARIISDGFSSMVIVSKNGEVTGHQYLPHPSDENLTLAPLAYVPIANWATEGKFAVALNRNGEILVFARGVLLFARRRGVWTQFSHKAAIKQMATAGPRGWLSALRQAAYLSALDVSFARCGGAIGLVKNQQQIVGTDGPVLEKDALSIGTSMKVLAINAVVGTRKYHQIGRRLRQELAAIDGATVVDHRGHVITAGAVLTIKISSDEGARKTAAKTLGRYGLGIKISSDGKIEAYTGEPESDQQPIFTLA